MERGGKGQVFQGEGRICEKGQSVERVWFTGTAEEGEQPGPVMEGECWDECLAPSCRAACQALGQAPSLLCLFLLSTALEGGYYLVSREPRPRRFKSVPDVTTAEK